MSDAPDSHALVAAYKELIVELGRLPTRNDCLCIPGFRQRVDRFFNGSIAVLRAACGVEETVYGAKRAKSDIFNRSIEQHIESYTPAPAALLSNEAFKKVLLLGDVHHPFAHWPTIEKACEFAKIHKPDIVVQGGDLYDHLSHNRFPKSMNIYMPKEEHELSRKHAEKMWDMVKAAVPDAKLYQLCGNHDLFILRRILEQMPSMEDWAKRIIKELMTFPGVETVEDIRESLILPGNVHVLHGYRTKLGEQRDFSLVNTVVFHSHKPGIVYRALSDGRFIWEMNAGYMGDEQSKGLSWTAQKLSGWIKCFGWIDEYGPRVVG